MIQNINVGTTPNDNTGDLLRNAFIIVNDNFTELQSIISSGATQADIDAAVAIIQISLDDIYAILDTKSDIGHTHIIANISGLQTALNSFVSATDFTSAIANINLSIANINLLIANINNDISTIQNNITIIESDIVDLQNVDTSLQTQINSISGLTSTIDFQSVIENGNTVSYNDAFLNILYNNNSNGANIGLLGHFTGQFSGERNTDFFLTDQIVSIGHYADTGQTFGGNFGLPNYGESFIAYNRNSDHYTQLETGPVNGFNFKDSSSDGISYNSFGFDFNNGFRLSTNNNLNSFIKADNLTATRTNQMPDNNGTILTTEGTTSGSPITGDIQVNPYILKGTLFCEVSNVISSLNLDSNYAGLSVVDNNSGYSTYLELTGGNLGFSSNSPTSKGLVGGLDYSANYDIYSYTQKGYIDTRFAGYLQSGTAINGNLIVSIGDVNGDNNSTKVVIDDASNTIRTSGDLISESDFLMQKGSGYATLINSSSANRNIYLPISGGTLALTSNLPVLITDIIDLDFGQDEENKTTITINNTLITLNDLKSFFIIPIETTETSLDDFTLNGVDVRIERIINNTSFDITASALNNASGKYTIKYVLSI